MGSVLVRVKGYRDGNHISYLEALLPWLFKCSTPYSENLFSPAS